MKTKNCSDKIAGELLTIAKNNHGRLTPQNVVDAARSKLSPLHSRFEWNDTKAAYLYRLDQARNIIRTVHVSYEKSNGSLVFRQFVSLSSDRNGREGYRLISCVMENTEHHGRMLLDAKEELFRFQQKYACLIELKRLWPAIRKIFD